MPLCVAAGSVPHLGSAHVTFLSQDEGDVVIHCSAEAAMLDSDEVTRLNELPDAAFAVSPEVECVLGDGHDGVHLGLAQSQDHAFDDQTHWWLQWADTGVREWTHEALCPAEHGDVVCQLPVEHVGEHYWF